MKFLLDAQLPESLRWVLKRAGHEVIHTLDLPKGNRTPDTSIAAIADEEGYIVVSKDSDFVISLLLKSTPVDSFRSQREISRIPNLKISFQKISNQLSRRSIQVRMSRSTGQT